MTSLLPQLSQAEWTIHGLVFLCNILLLIFSKAIINRIDPGKDNRVSHRLFITINILFLIFHFADLLVMTVTTDYQHLFIKMAYSCFCLYLAILAYKVGNVFIRRRFGKARTYDEEVIYLDTYGSRLVELSFLVIVFILTIYSLIKIWEMDSLLEATGIFGIIVGFIALTASVWAPDVLSGLIILNSHILEDGDVVKVDGYSDEYIIHKVSFIYTILYDIRNNHRTFIRNKRFIESKIDNLSRIASTDGIRKGIRYNLGYPDFGSDNRDYRQESLASFNKRVDALFEQTYQMAEQNKDIPLKSGRKFEWRLTNAGDFALEYTLFIYLEPVPSTKLTSLARKHLLSSLYTINSLVLEASAATGLELKTPKLLSLEPSNSQQTLATDLG